MEQMIHKDMTIEEIFSRFPDKSQKLAQEMTNLGLNCVGCCAATYETIEAGMMSHGFNETHIETLLAKLNAILDEKQDLSTISLTKKAADKFRQILLEEKKEGWALRFGERGAGCSGMEYVLDFSEKSHVEDIKFISEGVEIHVQKKSLGRLLGSVIDYVDGLQGGGFKISNPNVKSSCGCGNSHGY